MCPQLFGSLHGMCAHVKKQSVSTTCYGYLWCLIVDFATSAVLVANIWVILLVCDQVICEEPH